MSRIDEAAKNKLLALADYIIGLERGVRLDPDAEQATLLGDIIAEILALSPLKRMTQLGNIVQGIKNDMETEQAVADYDNDPGEGGNL